MVCFHPCLDHPNDGTISETRLPPHGKLRAALVGTVCSSYTATMISRRVTIFVGFWVVTGLVAGVVAGLYYALRPDTTVKLYIAFDNVPDLHTGAPVRLGGLRIGTVESAVSQAGKACDASLAEGAHLLVAVSVDAKEFHHIRSDSRMHITTVSPLGEYYVEVDIGARGAPVNPGDRLCGQPGMNLTALFDHATHTLGVFNEAGSSISSQVDSFRSKVTDLVFVWCELGWCSAENFAELNTKGIRIGELWKDFQTKLDEFSFPNVDLAHIGAQFTEIRDTVARRTASSMAGLRRFDREIVTELSEIVSELQTRTLKMQDTAQSSMLNTQNNLRNLSQRLADKRYTLGAFAADLEMQNDVKGLQRDLKRYLLRFMLSGGDESLPAR